MKTIYYFAFIVSLSASAQEVEKDGIEKAVNTYIESFFLNDSSKMFSVIHPALAKRGISKTKEGDLFYEEMSNEQLAEMLSRKKALERARQKNIIEILDLSEYAASVKLTTGYPFLQWIEYIHLLKISNEWQICNIVWDYLPKTSSK